MATQSSVVIWKISWKRSLVGYSPWDHGELDMTEQVTEHTCTQANIHRHIDTHTHTHTHIFFFHAPCRARILKWGAIFSSRGSSPPKD